MEELKCACKKVLVRYEGKAVKRFRVVCYSRNPRTINKTKIDHRVHLGIIDEDVHVLEGVLFTHNRVTGWIASEEGSLIW